MEPGTRAMGTMDEGVQLMARIEIVDGGITTKWSDTWYWGNPLVVFGSMIMDIL